MKDEIKRIKAEVAEYKRLASSVPGCSFDAIRVDGTKNKDAPHIKWVHRAIDKEDDLNQMIKNLPIVKAEILSTIMQLEDSNLKRVLIYRYIDCLTWPDIMEKIYMSKATVLRWHKQAIAQIKI
jgi:DNA-directed RNA polymerase specialized sigma subunit